MKISLSRRLRETRADGKRQPGGGIHATYYMRICTNDNECILHTYLSDRLSSFGR